MMTQSKMTLCMAALLLVLAVFATTTQAGTLQETSFVRSVLRQSGSLTSANEKLVNVKENKLSTSHASFLKNSVSWLQTVIGADVPNTTPVSEQVVQGLMLVVLAFFAAAICFAGYRLIKFLVLVIGFMLGLALCYLGLAAFGEAIGETDDWYFWVILTISVLAGIIGAVIAWKFFVVAVFLIGGAVGVCVAEGLNLLIYANFGENNWSDPVFIVTLVVLFVVFGFIAVKLQRPMLIIGTALLGALYLSWALLWLLILCGVSNNTANISSGCVLVVFAILGVVIQFRFTARNFRHDHHHGHYDSH